MATTTNYGWTTPNDTDLVKNGALAQRTTASAIDTTLFGITNGKNVGLVPLNITNFSAVNSVSINSIFTNDYKRYQIRLNAKHDSANNGWYCRLRSGTTDNTSNYKYSNVSISAYNGAVTGTNSGGLASAFNLKDISVGELSSVLDISNPNLTLQTTITAQSTANYSGTFDLYSNFFGGVLQDTTAYNGITFYVGGGTFTGTVSIYGVRNS